MNTTNLILHCGARAIDRTGLAAIPTPEATETWHPQPHIRLVELVEQSLAKSNMRIVAESYGVTDKGAKMFGLLQVANCKDTGEYAYVIGLRGAIDKTLSRGIAVGHSVFVCDNLAFSSEIVFHRKQTKNVEDALPVMVETAIGMLATRWDHQDKRIQAYKQKQIGLLQATSLLADMAGDVFPKQKFFDIRNEFITPRHPEFVGSTVWTMFNAVTEFLKPNEDSKASGLWTMPARTGRLHKICDDFAGVTLDIAPEPMVAEVAAVVEPV